jgi:hypothetical protein
MTLNCLVCACHNVFPVITKIKVMDNHGKELYLGVWSYGAIKDFGDLTVLYFKIDEINKNGVAKTLTAWTIKEDTTHE